MPVCTVQFTLLALTQKFLLQRAHNIVSFDDQTFAHIMVTIARPEGFGIRIRYLLVP
jgi:hypothetical protein